MDDRYYFISYVYSRDYGDFHNASAVVVNHPLDWLLSARETRPSDEIHILFWHEITWNQFKRMEHEFD